MSKFTVEKIEQIRGKQAVYKLFINNVCEFDIFCEQLLSQGADSILAKFYRRLEFFADLKYEYLPRTKFRELTGRKKSDKNKDYEFKEVIYRLYLFDDKGFGKIITFGGTKDNQDKNIERLRRIKIEYFKQKQKEGICLK